MEMMKKIALILIAVMVGGLVYFGMQRYMTNQSDDVVVQGWNSFKKSVKKGINSTVKKAAAVVGVQPGENGYPCASNSSCDSGNCATGLCQDKFDNDGPCSNDGQCKSGKCSATSTNVAGSCQSSCVANSLSCKNNDSCCSGNCEKDIFGGGLCQKKSN